MLSVFILCINVAT